MDLPKNITQIGESDQRCKIYVEDYGQAHQLLSSMGARHYLITLVKEDN